jgi:hypothetical protein
MESEGRVILADLPGYIHFDRADGCINPEAQSGAPDDLDVIKGIEGASNIIESGQAPIFSHFTFQLHAADEKSFSPHHVAVFIPGTP